MSTHYDISEDKELFEYLGRALYECQRLEVSLVYIIPDVRLLAGKIGGRDVLERLEKFQSVLHSRLETSKGMLGRLLKELRKDLPKFAELDDDSDRLLDEALEKRNEIVHHFFYKHWVAMITPVGRDVMLDDLKQSIRIISAAFNLSEKIRKQLDVRMQSDDDNTGDAC